MGVLDKFKDLVGIEEYDDDYLMDDDARNVSEQMERQKVEPRSNYRQRDKVVSMHRQASISALNLVVTEPAGFEECPKLVDSLKQRQPIIINLENLDSQNARKIFDFLSGATYALNGNVQKVANNIFIFAPENVDIQAEENDKKSFDFMQSESDDVWR